MSKTAELKGNGEEYLHANVAACLDKAYMEGRFSPTEREWIQRHDDEIMIPMSSNTFYPFKWGDDFFQYKQGETFSLPFTVFRITLAPKLYFYKFDAFFKHDDTTGNDIHIISFAVPRIPKKSPLRRMNPMGKDINELEKEMYFFAPDFIRHMDDAWICDSCILEIHGLGKLLCLTGFCGGTVLRTAETADIRQKILFSFFFLNRRKRWNYPSVPTASVKGQGIADFLDREYQRGAFEPDQTFSDGKVKKYKSQISIPLNANNYYGSDRDVEMCMRSQKEGTVSRLLSVYRVQCAEEFRYYLFSEMVYMGDGPDEDGYGREPPTYICSAVVSGGRFLLPFHISGFFGRFKERLWTQLLYSAQEQKQSLHDQEYDAMVSVLENIVMEDL